ncbi:MAG: hypothetical protein JST59_29670 [Actinobacteria bacterium]|nr:hypothetical protein [Actinomycetota bacterium]
MPAPGPAGNPPRRRSAHREPAVGDRGENLASIGRGLERDSGGADLRGALFSVLERAPDLFDSAHHVHARSFLPAVRAVSVGVRRARLRRD